MKDDVAGGPAAVQRPPGRPLQLGERRLGGVLLGAVVGEVLGTYLLVFIGAGTVIATKLLVAPDQPLDAVAIGLAFGFAVVIAVYTFGHVSGAHINPSVTVGLAATGRFPWRAVPVYVGAQLLGGILASLTHWLLFGERAREELLLGATTPGPRGAAIALFAEFVITFFLVTVIMATGLDDRSPGPVAAGLAIGLVVAAAIFATLPVSGGSLNAARTFGPMIISGDFPGWWAYLIGPVAGGVAGALTYDLVVRPGAPPGAGRRG
jgi:MIP family channel proteins